MGWFVKLDEEFVLIADDEKMDELTRKLMRIGLDHLKGYISDVSDLGIELEKEEIMGIDEFKNCLHKPEIQVIDVRGESEFNNCCIDGAENLFVGTLPDHIDRISRDKQLVIHCQSGDRSAIAFSILRKNGFKNVKNYLGGMKEWNQTNGPVISKSAQVCN
jgi:hydroxyacylglutathione hydrolase